MNDRMYMKAAGKEKFAIEAVPYIIALFGMIYFMFKGVLSPFQMNSTSGGSTDAPKLQPTETPVAASVDAAQQSGTGWAVCNEYGRKMCYVDPSSDARGDECPGDAIIIAAPIPDSCK